MRTAALKHTLLFICTHAEEKKLNQEQVQTHHSLKKKNHIRRREWNLEAIINYDGNNAIYKSVRLRRKSDRNRTCEYATTVQFKEELQNYETNGSKVKETTFL